MPSRRRFGRVRRLPSGRYQARYQGPDGVDRPAPSTFATRTDAERWLARTEVEIHDDHWRDPDLGRVSFTEYATAWIKERPGLRPNTVQVYGYVLTRHLVPSFGNRDVAADGLTGQHVGTGHVDGLAGEGPVAVPHRHPDGRLHDRQQAGGRTT